MNYKKIFLLLIITIFIILCVIFCVNKMYKKSNEKIELVFWTLQLGTFSDYIEPIISEFEKNNPEIKILWVDIPYSEGGKRTLAAILSDNPPDLINATPDFSMLLAQKNTLATFELKDMDVYVPAIMSSLSLDDGKTYYAIPFYATTAITIYNSELFKKFGYKEIPSSYEQMYLANNKAFNESGKYITMPTLNENDTFLKILNKYDLANFKKIKSKEACELIDFYKNLYKLGKIPKESLTQTHRDALEKYMSGQIVFYNGGANFLNMIKDNAPNIFNVTKVSPQIVGNNSKFDFSLMNLIIPRNSKNKKYAFEFAKLLTNKENQLNFAKLTTILPVNQFALEDDYFKTFQENDLLSEARFISAKQLKNVLSPIKVKSQKDLTLIVNNVIAEILLDKKETKNGVEEISNLWEQIDK